VILGWTPPTDRKAELELYVSVTANVWQQVDVDLSAAKGQVAVPVTWSGGRYCFMLVVAVRGPRDFTSNAVCLDDSNG
jgi:hypothetical protein